MSDNSNDGKVLYSGDTPNPNDSQTANPEGTVTADQNTDQSQEGPITRKEVMDLMAQNYRQVQSLTDKMASNFDKTLSEKLSNFNQNAELMKQAGVQLSEIDLAKGRQKILDETLAASGGANSNPLDAGQVNQQGTQSAQPSTEIMDQMLSKIDQQYGGAVMQEDPESQLIKMDDPLTFLKTYEAAAEAKAKRLQTPAAAKLTSLGTGANPSRDAEALGAQLLELQSQPQTSEVKAKRKEIAKQLSELEGR